MMTMRRGMMAVLAAAFLTGACATQDGTPTSSGSSMGGGTSASEPQGRPASGTMRDSLQACMGRIPADASAGQRMMAEQSCQRDAADKKGFMSAPGAQ